MLAIFLIAVLGVALAGLAAFVAMCVAIRHDDKMGLPRQAPSLITALTRRFLGNPGGRPVVRSTADRELCTVGRPGANQPANPGGR
jgi:hypothetical protein